MKHEFTDCSVFLLNVYFPNKSFPQIVYRILTFVCDDDCPASNSNTDDDGIYIAITLAELC